MQIEVVDGWMVRYESAEPTHQTIQRNFANHLWAAVKGHDASKRTCHRVNHDVDVLIAEGPKFHFRRPLTWLSTAVSTLTEASGDGSRMRLIA
jgi:hypothetical protein